MGKYTRKTTRQSWSQNAMRDAMRAVQYNGRSVHSASKQFAVPEATLRRYIRKYGDNQNQETLRIFRNAEVHAHHDVLEQKNSSQENLTIAKCTAMAVLFLASFILGIVPIKLNERYHWSSDAKHSFCVRFLLGIGGGVLLCTTFIHLLPEVKSNFGSLRINSYIRERFAEILLCAGFFMMYLIEECVHSYLHYRERRLNIIRRGLLIRRGEPLDKILKAEEEAARIHDDNAGHSHTVEFDSDNFTVIVRGLLVVLALSIHELFEGLAVGLESSSHTVWYMFGAVSAHKLVIAFCIGIELVTSGLQTFIIVSYVFIFAVVTPLGIGIGILVMSIETSATITSVVLQGLASGCLVYVIFFEILQGDKRSGMIQYLSILAGFGIMFAITFLDLGYEYT